MIEDNNKILLCSDCFKDEGLKLDSFQIGIDDNTECPNCKSSNGKKLSILIILLLCRRYFSHGTFTKTEYGGAPLIEFNEQHYKKSNIDVSSWLIDDIKLLEETAKVGFFILVQDYGCLVKLNLYNHYRIKIRLIIL